MASALQLNLEYSADILGLRKDDHAPSAIEREERRRLMWACYDIDIWNGSGVDQLTLLDEKDIKIQLPCSNRDFLHGKACITETLRPKDTLEFLSPNTMATASADSLGINAYYIRLVAIWDRMLRYVSLNTRCYYRNANCVVKLFQTSGYR